MTYESKNYERLDVKFLSNDFKREFYLSVNKEVYVKKEVHAEETFTAIFGEDIDRETFYSTVIQFDVKSTILKIGLVEVNAANKPVWKD